MAGRLLVFYATGDERTFCGVAAAELVCEPQSTFDRRLLARFGLRDSYSRSTADGSECGSPPCNRPAAAESTERTCRSRCGKGILMPASANISMAANATSLEIWRPLFSCITQKCSSKLRALSPNPVK